MKFTEFPDYPLRVSKICLGTMMFGEKCDYSLSETIIKKALELGINFFDTAAMYSGGETEKYLGKALKGAPRKDLFIGTKVFNGIDHISILQSIDESLSRLQMDYVDLYMIHWPVVGMNLTEMMGALNEVVQSGKARMVGCCNFPGYLLSSSNAIAAKNGWARLACNQVAYNLFERGVEVEILPQAILDGIAVTAYRPLAVGLLSGKFRPGMQMDTTTRGASDSRVITWLAQHGAEIERFLCFAEDKNLHPAQLAVAWVSHSAAVTAAIVGVSSLSQLESSVKAVEVQLTEADYQTITAIFHTEVLEEGLQLFPGLKYNFPRIRRNLSVAHK
jgi:1-deoxyxylulose-5-phosphate synthase